MSLEEFDAIKDLLEDLNSQLVGKDKLSDTQRCEHYIDLVHGLKSASLKQGLTLELRVN